MSYGLTKTSSTASITPLLNEEIEASPTVLDKLHLSHYASLTLENKGLVARDHVCT